MVDKGATFKGVEKSSAISLQKILLRFHHTLCDFTLELIVQSHVIQSINDKTVISELVSVPHKIQRDAEDSKDTDESKAKRDDFVEAKQHRDGRLLPRRSFAFQRSFFQRRR